MVVNFFIGTDSGKLKKNSKVIKRCVYKHYNDVIMDVMVSQITSLTIVYSTVYSGADQRKHQSSASLVFVWGIHRWPVNSPHKWLVTRKMFPFDDVIMVFRDNSTSISDMCIHLYERSKQWKMGWNHCCQKRSDSDSILIYYGRLSGW